MVSDISNLNRYKYKYSGHSALMGKRKCEWQDTGYVLSYFGKRPAGARRRYLSYVEAGVGEGRRPELVGGGLIRSLGGWIEVRMSLSRQRGQARVKGDQRILGESDFVLDVLSEAGEKFDRYYELKSLGYDLKSVEQRVCEIYKIDPEKIYSKSREKIRVEARGLFCYWAVRELGYALTDLAKRLNMSGSGVGYAVNRGERIAKHHNYQLSACGLSCLLRTSPLPRLSCLLIYGRPLGCPWDSDVPLGFLGLERSKRDIEIFKRGGYA